MRVDVREAGEPAAAVAVVALQGDLDASTAPAIQQRLAPLVRPGCRILFDLSGVPYLSSAGLRLLLSTYRQVAGNGGRMALVGVAEEIRDLMSITGFLRFFVTRSSVDEGLAALGSP
jgi:anti-sigma B factor antagonist